MIFLNRKRFLICGENGRTYSVFGLPSTTIDMVWASEKCWFIGGETVIITDCIDTIRTFQKEESHA